MTQREKRLALFTGGFIGIAAVFGLLKYTVYDPISELNIERAQLEADLQKKRDTLAGAQQDLRQYRALYEMIPQEEGAGSGATSDDARMKAYFGEVIDDILAAVPGFKEDKVRPPSTKKGSGRGRRKELDRASFVLDGHGDFTSVMQFLLEIFKRQDLLYVSGVDIKPNKQERSQRVSATVRLDSLVIPRVKKLLREAPEPDPASAPTGSRLALDNYDELLAWKPFDPHKEAPPKPRGACCLSEDECSLQTEEECMEMGGAFQGPNTRCRRETCQPKPVDEDPDPIEPEDPDRKLMIVRGFMSDDVLVVKDPEYERPGRRGRSQDLERLYFRKGAEFDGGLLEFVHRLGVVVAKKNKDNEETELWLYRYDEPFTECQLLEEIVQAHSEYRQIQLAMHGVILSPSRGELRPPQLPTQQLEGPALVPVAEEPSDESDN